MIEPALREMGLTANEIKIYLALTKLGSCRVSAVTERTKLNRSDVYDRLDKLMKKGLVSFVIKNNRKYFQVAEPESLLDYFIGKEEELKRKKLKIEKIIPELRKIQRTVTEKQEVKLYKDRAGIKTILEDILRTLKKDDCVLAYGSDANFYEILKYYYKPFIKRRIKQGIKLRCILSEGNKINLDLSRIKYISKSYHLPVGTAIYSSKVAIFLLKDIPTVILIENEDIARGYRDYFEWLWSLAKD